jgi:hypothetical protein
MRCRQEWPARGAAQHPLLDATANIEGLVRVAATNALDLDGFLSTGKFMREVSTQHSRID